MVSGKLRREGKKNQGGRKEFKPAPGSAKREPQDSPALERQP